MTGAFRRRAALAAALVGLSCASTPPTSGAAGAAAPAVVAPGAPEAQPAPVAKRLSFWRAQLGESTVHLLGSVHVARADLYPLDPAIEQAFESSEVLALELVLDEAAQVEVATRMMERARLPAGQRLNDVVSEQTLGLLERARDRQGGGGLFGLNGFHPWFVAVNLTMRALEQAGFSAEHGIDEYFKRRAGERRVVALETVDQQLDVFAGMSPEDEETMLRETLEDLDEQPVQLEQAFDLWRSGDADELDRLLLAPMRSEQPELYEKLFAARNRRMLEVLARLTEERPARYFVVVGAGHLVGPGGLVDLLRRSGHPVEQLEGETSSPAGPKAIRRLRAGAPAVRLASRRPEPATALRGAAP